MTVAKDLINALVPTLKKTDTVEAALGWMNDAHLEYLVVEEKEEFIGLVSEPSLLSFDALSGKKIGDIRLDYEDAYVLENSHIYDALRLFGEHSVDVIAVLANDRTVLGSLTVNDVAFHLSRNMAMQMPGSILVLSILSVNYSLQEIARLVETNQAKIIDLSVTANPLEPTELQITLKLNTKNLTHIVASFERFGYHVLGTFNDEETNNNTSERLDILLKYLEL